MKTGAFVGPFWGWRRRGCDSLRLLLLLFLALAAWSHSCGKWACFLNWSGYFALGGHCAHGLGLPGALFRRSGLFTDRSLLRNFLDFGLGSGVIELGGIGALFGGFRALGWRCERVLRLANEVLGCVSKLPVSYF